MTTGCVLATEKHMELISRIVENEVQEESSR